MLTPPRDINSLIIAFLCKSCHCSAQTFTVTTTITSGNNSIIQYLIRYSSINISRDCKHRILFTRPFIDQNNPRLTEASHHSPTSIIKTVFVKVHEVGYFESTLPEDVAICDDAARLLGPVGSVRMNLRSRNLRPRIYYSWYLCFIGPMPAINLIHYQKTNI